MPIYILVSKLTYEGRKTSKNNPDAHGGGPEIEKMGVKVLAQYATTWAERTSSHTSKPPTMKRSPACLPTRRQAIPWR
jgi:hypothetical protein